MALDPSRVEFLVIHCADTKADQDIGAKEIDRWHRQQGWLRIGYHFVIRRNGKLERGRSLTTIGAHVQGYNALSLGICMVGGAKEVDGKLVPDNNFTPAQWATLTALLLWLKVKYPKAQIVGHNQLTDKKACPSFDVPAWIEGLPH